MMLVVIGHAIQFVPGYASSHFENNAFVAIYAFHMPLFAVVMGAVLRVTGRRLPLGATVARRVRALLVPFLTWSALLVAMRQAAGGNIGFVAFWRRYSSAMLYPDTTVWYLWFAFIVSLVFAFAGAMPSKSRIYVLAGAALLFFVVPLETQFAFEHLRWLFPFSVLGYYLYGDNRVRQHLRTKRAAGLSLIAFVACFTAWMPDYSVYVDPAVIVGANVGDALWIWALRYIFAGSGVLIAVWFTRALMRTRLSVPLVAVGKETLGIYGIQTIVFLVVFRFAPYTQSEALQWLLVPLVALITLVVSFASSRLIGLYPASRVLLLGGRGAHEPKRVLRELDPLPWTP